MLRKFKAWFDPEPNPALLFNPLPLTIQNRAYTLRRMTNLDIDAALTIERAVYDSTPWDRVAFLSELRKIQHSLYLIATLPDNDEAVAFIGCWFAKDEAHVTNIAVAPAYQHQGLGRRLMQVMIDRAYAVGSAKMTLEVRTDNLRAQALYHQLGFKDGEVKKGYYVANHDDALDMWRLLD